MVTVRSMEWSIQAVRAHYSYYYIILFLVEQTSKTTRHQIKSFFWQDYMVCSPYQSLFRKKPAFSFRCAVIVIMTARISSAAGKHKLSSLPVSRSS